MEDRLSGRRRAQSPKYGQTLALIRARKCHNPENCIDLFQHNPIDATNNVLVDSSWVRSVLMLRCVPILALLVFAPLSATAATEDYMEACADAWAERMCMLALMEGEREREGVGVVERSDGPAVVRPEVELVETSDVFEPIATTDDEVEGEIDLPLSAPLPAAAWLLLAGLGALAVTRFRKSSAV